MKQKLILGLLALFLMVPAVMLGQDEMGQPDILITGVWARATAVASMMPESTPEMGMGHMGMDSVEGVSAAYMTIENGGDSVIRLVAAATDAAGLVEIHEVQMENDVMKMRPVEGGIEIPAGGSVELKPGGYHVMLMELKRELVAGEAVSLTLTFEMGEDGETHDIVLGAPILSEPPAVGDLVIVNAWARPTAAAMDMSAESTPEASMSGMAMDSVSAAYMYILNRGAESDRLVAAATDAAGLVEIHEMQMENDVMKMRPVEGGIEIPAGGSVELKPGGYHVMLMQLPRDLLPGQAIMLTLVFESGVEVPVAVPVYDKMNSMSMGH